MVNFMYESTIVTRNDRDYQPEMLHDSFDHDKLGLHNGNRNGSLFNGNYMEWNGSC